MAIRGPGGLIDRALRFLGFRTKAGDLLKPGPGAKAARGRTAAPKGKGRAGGGGG